MASLAVSPSTTCRGGGAGRPGKAVGGRLGRGADMPPGVGTRRAKVGPALRMGKYRRLARVRMRGNGLRAALRAWGRNLETWMKGRALVKGMVRPERRREGR